MKYIPVTGLNPTDEIKNIILNHFGAALISIAEPTTSKGWSIHQIFKQMSKIFKNFDAEKDSRIEDLLLDSGGFQILQGYISKNRLREYIDTYHILFEKFHEKMDKIFSLDVLTKNLTREEIFKFNKYSIESSLKLFRKYPGLEDKQLFIVQSRFPETLEIWKTIINENNVFDVYSRYSFGGLVGLKKETNAKFNHFVPMLFWLISYAKYLGKDGVIKHVHMLGQSSRLAIITATILEEITGIYITMDSSEVLRFSQINDKLPIIFEHEETHKLARTTNDLKIMMEKNIQYKKVDYCIETAHEIMSTTGKVDNPDFVELMCQGISSTVSFAKRLKDDNIDIIKNRQILDWTVEDFKNYHEIFKHGRLAQELVNNLRLAKQGIEHQDKFEEYHTKVYDLISDYYK